MLLSFDEIVGVDVDDVAADRLGRVEGQGQVLDLGVNGVGLLVEGALVDGVRAGVVDHFAEKNWHRVISATDISLKDILSRHFISRHLTKRNFVY